ncbi:MAG: hypothetical protein QF662_00970 [Phycisphaerae bacterium]|jgi:chromosome segregation ATPase|nr:hypothetical protein [Phycisphaerae bacterium]
MQNAVSGLIAVSVVAAILSIGCVNVSIPEGPYLAMGSSEPSHADSERVADMDRESIERDLLRLEKENDDLRDKLADEKAKREESESEAKTKRKKLQAEEKKKRKEVERQRNRLDDEVDDLEEKIEDLEKQIRKLKKRD